MVEDPAIRYLVPGRPSTLCHVNLSFINSILTIVAGQYHLRIQDLCMRVLTQQISPSLNHSRITIAVEYLLQMNLSIPRWRSGFCIGAQCRKGVIRIVNGKQGLARPIGLLFWFG